jgi:hypothetical protein
MSRISLFISTPQFAHHSLQGVRLLLLEDCELLAQHKTLGLKGRS